MFNIEVRECGAWETWDVAETLEDAVLLASSLVGKVREEWIRIVTPDGRIM
jgi:hypothetical protein